jgi:hypothetical protein
MLFRQRKTGPVALLLLAGLGLAMSPARSRAAEGSLDAAQLKELRSMLDVKNQPWTTIPWSYSITEARKRAAAAHKPIFMVVNTGNALGCT